MQMSFNSHGQTVEMTGRRGMDHPIERCELDGNYARLESQVGVKLRELYFV